MFEFVSAATGFAFMFGPVLGQSLGRSWWHLGVYADRISLRRGRSLTAHLYIRGYTSRNEFVSDMLAVLWDISIQ